MIYIQHTTMDNLFSNLSPLTKMNRINYLRKHGVLGLTDYEVLKDIDSIMAIVNTSTVPTTRSTRISHFIEFIKLTGDKDLLDMYLEKRDAIMKSAIEHVNNTATKVKADRYEVPLSARQEQLMSKNKFKVFDKTKASLSVIRDYQDYLLMCLYVMEPPIRNDYGGLIVVKKTADIKPTGNYLVITAKVIYLYLNEFKNKKSFGSTRVNFTKQTQAIIRNLTHLYKELKLDMPSLFNHVSSVKVEPMSEASMRERVKHVSNQYFGKPLSINDYRHLHEIAIQSDPDYAKLSLAEREKQHAKLLHHTPVAMTYNRV